MSDVNEIRALKASLRGAIDTAQTLAAMQPKVEALDDHDDPGADRLEELARVSTAHAVASSALRGLIDTMLKRRDATT
jgi:cation transport regulator ChaB